MNASLHPNMPLNAWLPLQSTAGALREECSSLEQLVQELFADLERLGVELEAKADELEEGRRHLAERGRQLAEQRKETARLSHQLEQQEAQLSEALGELRELRAELANRPVPAPAQDSGADVEGLRQQVTELQIVRAVLQERLETSAGQIPGDPNSPQVSALSQESLRSFSEQIAEQFSLLRQQLQASQPHAPPAADLEALKRELLEQQDSQLAKALAELRELRSELANRPKSPPVQDAELSGLRQQIAELLARLEATPHLPPTSDAPPPSPPAMESLAAQFDQQFAALQQQIQSVLHVPPEATELDALRKERQELESELELVRARSAELHETVTRQKRELAAQRSEVSEELKELRDLLVQPGEPLAPRTSAPPAELARPQPTLERHLTQPLPAEEESAEQPVDPVVNTVMAQFAKLQRDIAQRRKKK